MISERVQTSVYLAIVFFFVYVFLFFFGGLEKIEKNCFLWIPKVTFGSFSGLCFASLWHELWHESCCCLRLSQAVSKARFRDDCGANPDERLPGYSIFFNGILNFRYSILFNGIFISVYVFYVFLAMSEGSRLVFYGFQR